MTGPKYQHLETEKEIICEEVLESLDARGRMIDIDNLSHRFIFEGHSLAKPIEGTLGNVKGFSHRDLRRYQNASSMLPMALSHFRSPNFHRIFGVGLRMLLVGYLQARLRTQVRRYWTDRPVIATFGIPVRR